MKLIKVFSQGHVLNNKVYNELIQLDLTTTFQGCGNEFKENRDWWVILHKGSIVAYCGSAYSHNFCFFVRAWVHKSFRGKGWQRRMIRVRLNAARKLHCKKVCTYTLYDNFVSSNNLIKTGFLLYEPEHGWAGRKGILYWYKALQ